MCRIRPGLTDAAEFSGFPAERHIHAAVNYRSRNTETGPVFHSPDLERVCDYSGLNSKKPSDGHPRNCRPSVSSGSASGGQKDQQGKLFRELTQTQTVSHS